MVDPLLEPIDWAKKEPDPTELFKEFIFEAGSDEIGGELDVLEPLRSDGGVLLKFDVEVFMLRLVDDVILLLPVIKRLGVLGDITEPSESELEPAPAE